MTGQTRPQPYVAFEDYLAAERQSDIKHEWLDGVVYAMAGGTIEHGRLATKMTAALTAVLAGRCTVYSSDVMLYVRETNLATYPDGSVVCGPIDVQKVVRNGKVLGEAITNPRIVIEVLSGDSTEGYDRGEKFAHYMKMPSLQEYVLVSQTERRIEVYRRPAGRGHWQCEMSRAGETLTLHGELFRIDDLYGA
ncbi:MAG TPA: Uma2 family endonuclease [Labilithrix sp.]|jgi:Uma2 family endonuclease|nr:Uma2 family endonuclease [Labilithrix sp.]